MQRIYLDHNATTPLAAEALDAMLPFLKELYGNPSTTSWFGQEARRGLDRARRKVAGLLNASAREIVFCSGGTEANDLALRGVLKDSSRNHLVTTPIEHPAVGKLCDELEKEGIRVSYLDVDRHGMVDVGQVEEVIDEDTALVSVMLANNIVGTIEPVREIVEVCHDRGVPVHTDAVQAAGKIRIDVEELGVDLLSLSAHKLYGPKGVGALYARRGTRLVPQLLGGSQERKRRAGTENVSGIVGFGAACELAARQLDEDARRIAGLRDRLQCGVLEHIEGARVNGHPSRRLPNTLNLTLPGLDGSLVMMNLDALGIAISHGSACATGAAGPPHVLEAMGLPREEAMCTVRITLGRSTTEEEADSVLEALRDVVSRLGEMLRA